MNGLIVDLCFVNVKELLLTNFNHEPTGDQEVFFNAFSKFIYAPNALVFVVKGFAGTGKTSVVKAITQTLPQINCDYVLLAPTGRAAKVLTYYTGCAALTIHKKIYWTEAEEGTFLDFKIAKNKERSTFFIVDEASMVSSGDAFYNVLEDLLSYVFSGDNCRLVFIGDTAQLPPVGLDLSLALDESYLERSTGSKVQSVFLREVVRQADDSGILMNATHIRNLIEELTKTEILDSIGLFEKIKFKLSNDFRQVNSYDFPDELSSSYSHYGEDEVMVLCRSNKIANQFNREIRNRIKYAEEELSGGDKMMVVKNNYYWLGLDREAAKKNNQGFIANGDILEVCRVRGIEERYGFRFANVSIRLIDYPDEQQIEAKLLLDTIYSDAPALSRGKSEEMYVAMVKKYQELPTKFQRNQAIKHDPYFNALQVKFAYAITCHKSQGGQWDAVFVDQGMLTDDRINVEYLRWLYTAITRAKKVVSLVNFHEAFFE